MGNSKEMNDVTERLATALKAMEDAVAAKRHNDLTVESLKEQVQSLKESLDAELQRSEKLTAANEEVSKRIDAIVGSVQEMLPGD
jgi:predicted  nucleic acid-binding Zn-ribbon protein